MSGWTVETLKEYVEMRFVEQTTHLDERFKSQEEAIKKAEDSLSGVLQGFPQEYAKVVTLEEVQKSFEAIKSDHVQRREVEDLKKFQSKLLGAMALVVVILPIIVAFLVYLLTRHAVPLTPPSGG